MVSITSDRSDFEIARWTIKMDQTHPSGAVIRCTRPGGGHGAIPVAFLRRRSIKDEEFAPFSRTLKHMGFKEEHIQALIAWVRKELRQKAQ